MLSNQRLNSIFNLQVHDSASEVTVFSETHSARFKYTLDFIFGQLGLRYILESDDKSFESAKGSKINYSDHQFNNVINIRPTGLLSHSGINEVKPEVKTENGLFLLFPNNSETGFDIFAAVFYMISRYEEWQNFKKDIHGRFELTESILYKYDFHLYPVTDIWVNLLKDKLKNDNPGLRFSERKFTTVATLDIDNLFAFKHKGVFRTAGAFAKDVLRGNFRNALRRSAVLSNKSRDPFDVYSSISDFCAQHSIPLICFFLMATGTKYDRSVDPGSEAFKHVFDILKKNNAALGIHPSYFSEENKLLQKEINHIKEKINSAITFSRQHYLRFDIKSTPEFLLSEGISHDFTMGFASGAGFRAGTCFPFQYYNFKKESPAPLQFVPFCAMDGAYMVYGNINAEAAFTSLVKLQNEVWKVNGYFVTVFHERTFDDCIAKNFGEMYKSILVNEPLIKNTTRKNDK